MEDVSFDESQKALQEKIKVRLKSLLAQPPRRFSKRHELSATLNRNRTGVAVLTCVQRKKRARAKHYPNRSLFTSSIVSTTPMTGWEGVAV